MKIILTANSAWNFLNFRLPLIQHFLSHSHEVVLLAPNDASVPKLKAMGCRFEQLDMSARGMNPITDLQLLRRYSQVLRREKPDVVLGFTIKNNIYGAIAAQRLKIPFVPNITGLGAAFMSGLLLSSLAVGLSRFAFSKLDAVFFQNQDDQALFIEKGIIRPSQAHLLPGSGIDLDLFQTTPMPANDQPTRFLMVARLLLDKGVLEYVQAAKTIKAQYPSVQLQLLGGLPREGKGGISQDQLDGWVAEGLIDYLGETDDVRPLMAQATCIVLPSYREGAPRALIEAAALARPLIATDVPGSRTVVDDKKTGFLCRVKDPESLTKALSSFLALRPEEQAKMGMAGRLKMQREFGKKIVVDRYQKVISAVASAQ